MQLSTPGLAKHIAPGSWKFAFGSLLPGTSLALLLALLSSRLALWLGSAPMKVAIPASPVVIAIALGIAISTLTKLDKRFYPGLMFSQCRILQLGVTLLGIRLSFSELATIGLNSLPLIALCICSALILVNILGKRLRVSRALTALIAAGTSICGATAIMTAAPIIGARNHEVSYAIACITFFGIIATLAYPVGAHWLFDGDAQRIGLFLGTAVHDTAQVVGAGMIYQNLYGTEQVLDAATVTKLVRNLAMLIVIPALSIMFRKNNSTEGRRLHWASLVPVFIVGFVVMSLLRTAGDLRMGPLSLLSIDQWNTGVEMLKHAAEYCLLIAMAAIGLNTKLSGIIEIGFKPLVLGLTAACALGVISSTCISLLY